MRFNSLDTSSKVKFNTIVSVEFLNSSTNLGTQNTFIRNLSSINDSNVNLILKEVLNTGSSFQTNERGTNNDDLLRVLEVSLKSFEIREITEGEDVLRVDTINGDSTRSTTSSNQELIEVDVRLALGLNKVTIGINFSNFNLIDNIDAIGFEEFLVTIL